MDGTFSPMAQPPTDSRPSSAKPYRSSLETARVMSLWPAYPQSPSTYQSCADPKFRAIWLNPTMPMGISAISGVNRRK